MVFNDKIQEDTYLAIYDELKDKSYGTSTSVTVTAAYVDDVNKFPQIVIHSPEIDVDTFSFGHISHTKDARVFIELFARKRKDIDIMASKVMKFLVDATNFPELNLQSITSTSDFQVENDNKIHTKGMVFTFRSR
jgi:hypothetical protein